jgi:hypothetical protein
MLIWDRNSHDETGASEILRIERLCVLYGSVWPSGLFDKDTRRSLHQPIQTEHTLVHQKNPILLWM